ACEEDDALDIPQLAELRESLHEDSTALADIASRRKFGFPLGELPPESYVGELNGKRLRLVGHFHLGVDFATDGNLFMTTANFVRYFPYRAAGGDPLRLVDVGIVRLEHDADIGAVEEN